MKPRQCVICGDSMFNREKNAIRCARCSKIWNQVYGHIYYQKHYSGKKEVKADEINTDEPKAVEGLGL